MKYAFELNQLTKKFGSVTALDGVSLAIPPGSVVGLVGQNGSGKTTLLRHLIGLTLPTSGNCTTLETDSAELGPEQLSRIGAVHQENRFLTWMTVEQHLNYVGSFYETWDRDLQARLLKDLDLDRSARVGALSTGNAQKLGILLAVCHHPELLVLDEPVSALDPIARETLLAFLLELLQEKTQTIVVSSHILRDIEKIVNWVVCLKGGKVKVDASLDDLQERFSEWVVTSKTGKLPVYFEEPYILVTEGNSFQAQVFVRDANGSQAEFQRKYEADVEKRPLNLERMFPLFLEEKP
jgi:ABC-2 type transport system ATP-binding protein